MAQEKEWVLEAQRFEEKKDSLVRGRFMHVGYVDKIFETSKQAGDYYNSLNPKMRSLNAHETWSSDWDPVTKLRFVVRQFDREVCALSSDVVKGS